MNLLSLSWWRVVFAKGGRAFALGCALVFILPIVISAGFSLRQGQPNQPTVSTGTIAVVNGQSISERDFAWIPAESLGGTPGDAHAAAYGRAIYSLVVHQVVEQLAAKLKIHASDADVDRAIAKVRESKLGPNASSSDWDTYLADQMHTSSSEFRDYMQGQADVEALVEHYKSAEKVTIDDAKNQYSEVKLATVFIGAKSATSGFPGAPKSLPDTEALIKANDLHAKVLAGADIIALAKANPDPFSNAKTTGISDWRKENQENQFGSSLMFGKDVDAAVRKTPTGQITDVVKATGFMSGYFFAKVVDRRVELPKDYDVNKVIATLKEQRADKKIEADIKAAVNAAKIVFPKDQPGMKAYYDYEKLQTMQQDMSGGMMGSPSANPPTQVEVEAQRALVDADWEALLKAHSDDSTAILMVAQSLRTKMATEAPAEQAKTRDRLIGLYDTAFKTTEDIPTRFVLAGLYHDKQDYKSAYKQYAMVIKLLAEDPPYDLTTRQKELSIRNQLQTGLNGLPAAAVPEAAAGASDQAAKIAVLNMKIKEDQAKQAIEQQKQDDARKAAQKKATEDAAAAAKLKTPPSASTSVPGAPISITPTSPGQSGSSGAAGSMPSAPGTASGAPGQTNPAPKK